MTANVRLVSTARAMPGTNIADYSVASTSRCDLGRWFCWTSASPSRRRETCSFSTPLAVGESGSADAHDSDTHMLVCGSVGTLPESLRLFSLRRLARPYSRNQRAHEAIRGADLTDDHCSFPFGIGGGPALEYCNHKCSRSSPVEGLIVLALVCYVLTVSHDRTRVLAQPTDSSVVERGRAIDIDHRMPYGCTTTSCSAGYGGFEGA